MSDVQQTSQQRASSKAIPEGAVPGRGGGWLKPIKPGQALNPGGQNLAKYAAVRKLAAENSLDSMHKLIDLVKHGQDERVQYMAAMAVIERGIGKPRDHSKDDDMLSRIDISTLSVDDRAILARLLGRVMGVNVVPEVRPTTAPTIDGETAVDASVSTESAPEEDAPMTFVRARDTR